MSFLDSIKNAKQSVRECTKFTVDGIKHICKNIGPRPCGHENEKQAQSYMAQSLKEYADTVERETFKVHPDAFMAFVPIAGGCMIASTAASIFGALKKKNVAFASFGLASAALSGIIGEFLLYKEMLDPLFKEKESGNVIAVRKAGGETKRRIILAGHTDSAPEWTYTYKVGSHGSFVVAGPAIAGLFYNVISSALTISLGNKKLTKGLALGQLAFVPFYAALFMFTNGRKYVDGATDNLSGAYISAAVLKFLADNDIRFENTEVVALLTGGEEAGIRGSKAFFKAHPEIGKDGVETVFASIDTIRDEDFISIYNRDMSGMIRNDEQACWLMKNAAEKIGIDVPMAPIPLGATDAAAASQAGVKAASLVAMDPAPARYYHTRLDTAENLKPETIEKGLEIAIQTVFDFDENGFGE